MENDDKTSGRPTLDTSMSTWPDCNRCNGGGHALVDSEMKQCPDCDGKGKLQPRNQIVYEAR